MSEIVVNVALKCNIDKLVNHVAMLLQHNETVQLIAIEGAIINAMDIAMKLKEQKIVDDIQTETGLQDMETKMTGIVKSRAKLIILLRKNLTL